MIQLRKQVLDFFCLLEIALGLWMISGPLRAINIIRILEIYSPLWILGLIFIFGGGTVLYWQKKHFWIYIILVSIPLTFFGFIYLQAILTYHIFTVDVIVFNMIGIYSAIYAGQVFGKERAEK